MVAKESLFLLHCYPTSSFLNLVPLMLQEPQTQCPTDTVADMKSGFHNNRSWLTLGHSESTSPPPILSGDLSSAVPLHYSIAPQLYVWQSFTTALGANRHIQPSHRKPIPGYNTLELHSPCDLGTACPCLKDGFSFCTFC